MSAEIPIRPCSTCGSTEAPDEYKALRAVALYGVAVLCKECGVVQDNELVCIDEERNMYTKPR